MFSSYYIVTVHSVGSLQIKQYTGKSVRLPSKIVCQLLLIIVLKISKNIEKLPFLKCIYDIKMY